MTICDNDWEINLKNLKIQSFLRGLKEPPKVNNNEIVEITSVEQANYSLFNYYCLLNENNINDITRALLGDEASLEIINEKTKPFIDDKNIDEYLLENSEISKLNQSQRKAIVTAINNKLSIIKGPPGTGKTETILNLVSCILGNNGECCVNSNKVAVVSNNRHALNNIKQKIFVKSITEQRWKVLKENYAFLGNADVRNKTDKRFRSLSKDKSEKLSLNPNFEYNKPTLKKGIVIEEWKVGGWEEKITQEEYMNTIPFITSTIHSLPKCFKKDINDGSLMFPQFDYVIIDEASQCDLLTGLISANCAKHLIVVGDENQLSPIVNDDEWIAEIDSKLPSNLRSIEQNSLLSNPEGNSILQVCVTMNITKKVPTTLLNHHYRCHPGIIQFCNQEIYDKKLEINTKTDRFYTNKIEKPIKILWYEGNYCQRCYVGEDGTSKYNLKQIELFKKYELCYIKKKLEEYDDKDFSVCFMSPYRGQLKEIEKMIREDVNLAHYLSGINKCDDNITKDKEETFDVDDYCLTIHKSQGQEYDLVYLFAVEDGDWEWPWSQGKRLINVAVSRAKQELRLFASTNLMTIKMQKELLKKGDVVKPTHNSELPSKEKLRVEDNQKYIQKLCTYVYGYYKNKPSYRDKQWGLIKSEQESIFDKVPIKRQKLKDNSKNINSVYATEEVMKICIEKVLTKINHDVYNGIDLINVHHNVPIKFIKENQNNNIHIKNKLISKYIKNGAHFDFVIYDSNNRNKVLMVIEVDGGHHRFDDKDKDNTYYKYCDENKNSLITEVLGGKLYDFNVCNIDDCEFVKSPIIMLRFPDNGKTFDEEKVIYNALIKQLHDNNGKSFYFNKDDYDEYNEVFRRGEPLSLTKWVETINKHNISNLNINIGDLNDILSDCRYAYIENVNNYYIPTKKGKEIGILESKLEHDNHKTFCKYSDEAISYLCREVPEFRNKAFPKL